MSFRTKEPTVGFIIVDAKNHYQRMWLDYMTRLKRDFGGELPYSMEQQEYIDKILGIEESDSLLILHNDTIVGCARFVKDNKQVWILIGIYICPEHQRQGILTKLYPQFKDKYGDFFVAPPYSEAMQGFLEKQLAKEAAFKGLCP